MVFLTLAVMGVAHAETKKVCHDVKKGNKTVQQCKNIKIHKKFDGTPVPTKK